MIHLKRIVALAALFIAANCVAPEARAQGGFDDDTDDGPSDMPLDGSLTLALAGGFGYVVKKVNDKRKSEEGSI